MPPPRRTVERARELRRQMTMPEVKLWQYLRTRPNGLRFRRQHPVGRYVLDFYCPATKFAIEVDGEAHDRGDRPERDQIRDESLAEQGIATLRLAAIDVMREFDAVTRLILAECGKAPLHHSLRERSPSPSDDGEES